MPIEEIHKKIRIAVLTDTFPPRGGGVASAHYNLFQAFKSQGYEVKAFSYFDNKFNRNNNSQSNEDAEEAVRKCPPGIFIKFLAGINLLFFKIFSPGKKAAQFANVLYFALGALQLNKPLKKYKPHVIIVADHGVPGYFLKKPVNCIAIWVSHHNPTRFLNNPLINNFPKLDIRLYYIFENQALKKFDYAVCPSENMAEEFIKTYKFNKQVLVIPNAIGNKPIEEIPVTNIRKKIGLNEDSLLICIPAAGNYYKGTRYVAEIIRKISSATEKDIGFYLSGHIDKQLIDELSSLPAKVKLYVPGLLNWQKNISIHKACSFTVTPTLIESFGMAIAEACFCGQPVVSFDVGGNRDLIENSLNGFIVPYLDVKQLISRSIELFDNDIREKMGAAAKKLALERFSDEFAVKKYETIFEDALEKGMINI